MKYKKPEGFLNQETLSRGFVDIPEPIPLLEICSQSLRWGNRTWLCFHVKGQLLYTGGKRVVWVSQVYPGHFLWKALISLLPKDKTSPSLSSLAWVWSPSCPCLCIGQGSQTSKHRYLCKDALWPPIAKLPHYFADFFSPHCLGFSASQWGVGFTLFLLFNNFRDVTLCLSPLIIIKLSPTTHLVYPVGRKLSPSSPPLLLLPLPFFPWNDPLGIKTFLTRRGWAFLWKGAQLWQGYVCIINGTSITLPKYSRQHGLRMWAFFFNHLPRVNLSSAFWNPAHTISVPNLTTLLPINVYFPIPKYSALYMPTMWQHPEL